MEQTTERNRMVVDKNGKSMFYIDGKLTTKKKYEDIMGEIEKEIIPTKENVIELCPFCQKQGNYTKFINLQKIKLCEEHYQTKTGGEIAQAVREQQDDNSSSNRD